MSYNDLKINFKVEFPEYKVSMWEAKQAAQKIFDGFKVAEERGGDYKTAAIHQFMQINRGKAGSIDVEMNFSSIADDEKESFIEEIKNSLPITHSIVNYQYI